MKINLWSIRAVSFWGHVLVSLYQYSFGIWRSIYQCTYGITKTRNYTGVSLVLFGTEISNLSNVCFDNLWYLWKILYRIGKLDWGEFDLKFLKACFEAYLLEFAFSKVAFPLGIGHIVNQTFRRYRRRLLNILFTFSLRPVSKAFLIL